MPRSTPPSAVSASLLQPCSAPDDDLAEEAGEIASSGAEAARREGRIGPGDHGQRLDTWLVGLAGEYSRTHLKGLIEAGCVQVDGVVVSTPSRKVLSGQSVVVDLRPTAQSQSFVAESMELPILYEDADLLIIDKPAGLVVHPAAGNWSGTLMNGLLAHHPGAAALPRAGIVHRLDKDTSGLMVVGKTLEAVTALSRDIAAREVRRQYLALAHGSVPPALLIEAPLARDPASRVKMAVVRGGKPARTDVVCLGSGECSLPDGRHGKISAVECTLHTGRTHQIRVHLSSRNHPLVADSLYGGAPALGLRRQALHAYRLAFRHPAHGGTVAFASSLPEDLALAWRSLGLSPELPPTHA